MSRKGDPPPVDRPGRAGGTWRKLAEKAMQTPGVWIWDYAASHGTASKVAHGFRTGQFAYLDGHRFEATTRKVDDRSRVYVKCLD